VRDQLIDLFGGTTSPVGGRRRWAWLTVLLVVLGTVELGVVAVLGHAVLPTVAALVLDGVGLVALVGCGAAAASVMVRRHRVGLDEVRLVLGVLGEARVPLSDVVALAPLPPLASVDEASTGPAFGVDCLVLTAGTGLPRVKVGLARPVMVRRLWQRREVVEVVVSLARRPLTSASLGGTG
jgi:hypothetical protein